MHRFLALLTIPDSSVKPCHHTYINKDFTIAHLGYRLIDERPYHQR
jgi:hypothetical protein